MMGRKMWERFSKDIRLPKWQRAAAYCWAHCDRAGHCPLPENKLGDFLGCKETREVNRVVKRAVEMNWLSPGSNARCLVAVYNDVRYSAGNYKTRKDCEFH